MKETICTILGAIGSGIAAVFGGWNAALLTLIIFMSIDYITGLVVAGVFHKSSKSSSGALQSHAGFKGLCKKGAVLLIILVSARLDLTIGTTYIRDAVCIAYIANEAISIIENVGLMGVPMPQLILKAIDVLKNKSEKEN